MTWCRGINPSNMMKTHLSTLDGNNKIRVSLPLLCQWVKSRKIEPKTKHLSHCKKNQSSWPNQTDSSKRNTKIWNHAYKNLEKIQIIFIDKMIIDPQFIDLDKQTAKKITLDRSPRTSRRTWYWESKREKLNTKFSPSLVEIYSM